MEFKLKFESLSGDTFIIEVTEADRIDKIKRNLSKENKIRYENLGFLFKSQFLFSDKFVSDYQMGNEEIVVYFEYENCERYSISNSVDERLKEFNIDRKIIEIITVFVKCFKSKKTYHFEIPPRSTVAHLKQMLFTKMYSNPFGIVELVFQGKLLSDNRTLELYDLDDGDTIIAITKWLDGSVSNQYPPTFEFLTKLGIGSFGTTFQCKEKSSSQIYALKQLEIFIKDDKTNFERQLVRFLSIEKHPRIIELIKQINDIDSSYLLMEYIDHGSIGSIIRKNGALSEIDAAKYAQQILEGLEYLHIHRIIHGNIKGNNILLDGNGNVKLSDFGLRTIFRNMTNRNSPKEVLKSEIGAINWLSPEVIKSGRLVPASDIWSFGAVMVEMITGYIPHFGLSVGQIVFAIMKGHIQFTYPVVYKNHAKSFISICLKAQPRERANFDDLYEHSFLK